MVKLVRFVATIVLLTVCIMLQSQHGIADALPGPDLSREEILRLGERMYRDGILPSGAAMEAYIRGDVKIDSTAFSCSSCHLRAGIGSVEGGVITPPTTGTKLYKPYRRPPSLDNIPDRAGRSVYAKTVVERPAYTRETLAAALRFGKDPAGQSFNDVMPRYPLSDRDMGILIRYLEYLSSEPSPGANNQEISFATIITDDVTTEDRQALLQPLQTFIEQKNQQYQMFSEFKKFGYTPTADMKYAFRKATFDVWELNGPPESWTQQLESYLRKKPVFAILGGISNQDWKPIHNFCERQHIPCLFPITDYPVLSPGGWYTLYFSKGYAQEGEAVARYLHNQETITETTTILQIVQDSRTGMALATGFQTMWHELGHQEVSKVILPSNQLGDSKVFSNLMNQYKPSVVLLWADANILSELPMLVERLPVGGMVFLSSEYLGNKSAEIPEAIRNRIYLTFPYRLTPYVGPKTGGLDAKTPILPSALNFGDRRIASRTTDALKQATLYGLSLLQDTLVRDHLLDIMSMQMDLVVRDYERLSFGPGQRYAAKGCYIIQLGSGTDPELIPKNEWVMH